MSIQPLITFKAGKCDVNSSTSPPTIKPISTPGYLYLYSENELVHFCWRARDASLSDPEMDLTMVPTDGTFRPYTGPTKPTGDIVKSPVNGRIYVLKFSSSSTRHFFWLQSREQPVGDPSKFSQRDLRLGEIVDNLLQGEEVDGAEIQELRQHREGGGGAGDAMEGVQSTAPSGGAPSSGQNGVSRGSGGSGDRSAPQGGSGPQTDLHRLLASIGTGNQQGGSNQFPQQQLLSTTLSDLLTTQHTVAALDAAPVAQIDSMLLHHLPPQLLEHAAGRSGEPSELLGSLSESKRRQIVTRVLRSPQFMQALASTTTALRDGGLPGVSEALGVQVAHGGWTGPEQGRGQPLTGGAAIEAFIKGARQSKEKR